MSRTLSRLRVANLLRRRLVKRDFYGAHFSESPSRILVLHHLLLGDALMLTPLLAKLREKWEAAEIILACPKLLMPLYRANPFGVHAVPFDPRDEKTLSGLEKYNGFDVAYIPAENRFSPLAKALGCRWIVAFEKDSPAWKNWLIDDQRLFPRTPATFGDFAADLIDGPPPQPFACTDWPLADAEFFEPPPPPYAVLHLGASTPLKSWPSERWMTLAQWLADQGLTPVWSAGKGERGLLDAADPLGRFKSFAGCLDLLQLAQLIKSSALLVCPDTGVAHLGRITSTPTVALFGPGSPELCGAGKYWSKSAYRAIAVGIECRNQHVTFRRHAVWIERCARSFGPAAEQCQRPLCMERITLEAVQGEVLAVLAQAAPGQAQCTAAKDEQVK